MNTPQQRQTGSFGDELTNAALIGLVSMFGVALILRASGSVAAFLTGPPQPDAGPAAGRGRRLTCFAVRGASPVLCLVL